MEGRSIKLSWDAHPEPDIQSYEILINVTNRNNSFFDPVSIPPANTEYIYTNLVEETKYYFVINALDKYSPSTWSNIASNTTFDETAPAAPTGLSIYVHSQQSATLSWDGDYGSDVDGYHIYKNDTGNGPNGSFHRIGTIYIGSGYHVDDLAQETTYFFKVMAFDEVPNNSTFSEVVFATTPDQTPPTTPTGFKVTNATYDSLTLTWDPNPEKDVVGYFIYRYNSPEDDFGGIVNPEPFTDPYNATEYIDTWVEEDTTYYYRLLAVDDKDQRSPKTELISGTTLKLQRPPGLNNTIADFSIDEDTIEDSTINLYYLFKDPDSSELDFRCEGQVNITVTIDQKNGNVELIPKKDWSGAEILIFYANDSLAEHFEDIMVEVKPVNDTPGPAMILEPIDGKKIKEGDLLTFSGQCSDPDLIYGDDLTFSWVSSIDGDLGSGEKLENITLTSGQHVITLEVEDDDGENISASINIIVQKRAGSSELKESSSLIIIIAGIVIGVVVFAVIFAMLLRKKKVKDAEMEDDGAKEEVSKEQPPIPQTGAQLGEIPLQPQIGPPHTQPQVPTQVQMYPQQQPQQQLQQQPAMTQSIPTMAPEQTAVAQPGTPDQEQMQLPLEQVPAEAQIPQPDNAPELPPIQAPVGEVEEPQPEPTAMVSTPEQETQVEGPMMTQETPEPTIEVETQEQPPVPVKPENSESDPEAEEQNNDDLK